MMFIFNKNTNLTLITFFILILSCSNDYSKKVQFQEVKAPNLNDYNDKKIENPENKDIKSSQEPIKLKSPTPIDEVEPISVSPKQNSYDNEKTSVPINLKVNSILPKPEHIVVVILENHAYEQIIDDSAAPYINEISRYGAVFTESYGLTHPSQPNYLMLFSGSNHGIFNDEYPKNIPFSTPNLASYLIKNKNTFIGYSEDLPSVGFTGAKSGQYASKHSPWVYWQGEGENRLSSEVNRPFSDFPSDFTKLPDVAFVIPNLDNDMHNGIFNGIIKTGDKWLRNNLDSYIKWAKNNNSLFILTFDEDNYLHKNNIATVFIGESVKAGRYDNKINHYNLLRTIEDIYQLPYAGESANSNPITNCWNL
ncbi:MAG: alkaline phosphatase family protein [Candidatus Sericytochromatia bacterium]